VEYSVRRGRGGKLPSGVVGGCGRVFPVTFKRVAPSVCALHR
jgi:hypothetical protein